MISLSLYSFLVRLGGPEKVTGGGVGGAFGFVTPSNISAFAFAPSSRFCCTIYILQIPHNIHKIRLKKLGKLYVVSGWLTSMIFLNGLRTFKSGVSSGLGNFGISKNLRTDSCLSVNVCAIEIMLFAVQYTNKPYKQTDNGNEKGKNKIKNKERRKRKKVYHRHRSC